ncbi:MAG: hypothetical protein KGH99_01595 [Thaumarchaeota archaeon]|nr:hypothetical protein [Nitrososphaerota archaeon]MDE1872153.1 hypothetical protein [Nitrososphaerota archaeon]
MTKNTTLVFAIAVSAMLSMSPVLVNTGSLSFMAFADDSGTNNTDNSGDVYVNGTSSDGTVVVNIASKTPTANQSLPMVLYFTYSNGTEIDEMHYSITAEQDGNQLFSLPHVFLNKGMTQHNTPPLTTDDPVNVQVTILGIGLPYDQQHWIGPIGDVINLQIGTAKSTLSVTTDQSSYHHGDTATISATLGSYGQGNNIAITASDPNGTVILSRAVQTDQNGVAQVQFKIPDSYIDGTYDVTATADAGGMTYKDTAQFSIEGTIPHFTIVSVEATDQNGNPVSSFSRGSTGYAKITVSTDSNQTALITTDLFDANSVSLGVGSVKTNLGEGESQMIVSFYIPQNAVVGTANIYGDAFSDWPSNNGTPLTDEVSSSVEIQ